MIYLESRHRKIVEAILKKYPYTFYVFGSRAKGTQKRLSDLDLCFFEPIPINIQSHIDGDFEESDLPFKVDVVDWQDCSDSFRQLIAKDCVPLQTNANFPKIEQTRKAQIED